MSHTWRRWLVASGLALAGILSAGTLVLQGQPDEAVVRLAGAPVLVVGPTSEETADDRAARIERRLERLADRVDEVPQPVVVRQGDGTAIVSVADSPVVTVSRADAEENVTTVDALATSWAGAIDVRLELRFWTDSRRADMVSTTSDVRRRIVEAFRRAEIPLPDPGLQRVLLTASRTTADTPASSRGDT